MLRTLHKLGLDGTEPVRVRGVEVAPRDVVAAALPDPATLGDRMRGQDLRGHLGDGDRHGRAAARGLPVPRGRQRAVDARVRPPGRRPADRDQPGRRARAARRGRLAAASACSAPRRSTRCRSSSCSPTTAPRTGARSASRDRAARAPAAGRAHGRPADRREHPRRTGGGSCSPRCSSASRWRPSTSSSRSSNGRGASPWPCSAAPCSSPRPMWPRARSCSPCRGSRGASCSPSPSAPPSSCRSRSS